MCTSGFQSRQYLFFLTYKQLTTPISVDSTAINATFSAFIPNISKSVREV